MSAQIKNPPLIEYVGPSLHEIHEVIRRMQAQIASLQSLSVVGAETTTAMLAEEIASSAFQIRELSVGIHRGIARRLGLEARL